MSAPAPRGGSVADMSDVAVWTTWALIAAALIGVVLGLAGVPAAVPIAAAAAFVAAFLNAAFDYCLGCQLYLLLVRAGVLGRGPAAL